MSLKSGVGRERAIANPFDLFHGVMPEYLALEWDSDQVSGLVATVTPGSVRVRKCVQFRRPDDWSTLPVEAAGAWLKDRLAEAGIRCDKALVSLPRSEVVMKRLEVPDVPDDELPSLVRFQAAAKAAQAIDELALDFLPTPRREGMPREVLAATTPRSEGQQLQAMFAAAGLQLVSLGITPVSLAEIVARVASPVEADIPADSQATVVISRHGPRLEVFVLRREVLIFSHGTRLREDLSAHEQAQATVGEISRALVSLRAAIPGLKISQAWLLADPTETSGLASTLRPRLGCEVQMLDPFSTVTLEPPAVEPVDVSWYAGPIGMLLAKSGARAPAVDFLAPRQPPVKSDPRKAQFTRVAIAAGVLAVLGIGWYAVEYSRLSALVSSREAQDADLAQYIKAGENTLKQAEAVQEWTRGEVAWLEQFDALSKRLPKTDRIYFSKVTFGKPLGGDAIGRVTLEGFARERSDVIRLNDHLTANGSPFQLLPPDMNPSKDEPYYKWSFKSDVVIKPPEKGQKAASPQVARTGQPGAARGEPPNDAVKGDSGKPEAKDQKPAPQAAQPAARSQTTGGPQS